MNTRFHHVIFSISLFAVLGIAMHGCYTSLQHPPVPDHSWGQVRVSDDCLECHDQHPQTNQAFLPQAAQQDYNWQFYYDSPWWQDESVIGVDPDVAFPPERTGPRSFGSSSTVPGGMPATVPSAVPSTRSLGKSSADAEDTSDTSSEESSKRSFGRRQPTTSESKDSDDPESKRSRRNR